MIDLEKTKLTEFTAKSGRKIKMLATITVVNTKIWIGAEFVSSERFNLRKYNRYGRCCEVQDHEDYDIAPYFEITEKDMWRVAKTADNRRVLIILYNEGVFQGCIEGNNELDCWDANGIVLFGLDPKNSLVAWE